MRFDSTSMRQGIKAERKSIVQNILQKSTDFLGGSSCQLQDKGSRRTCAHTVIGIFHLVGLIQAREEATGGGQRATPSMTGGIRTES